MLARLLQSGPRVSLRRVPPMFPRAARSRAMVRTRSIEPLIVYDYQPGVIVRSYWLAPWQNRHYFPKTGKRPKVGRLERVTAHKSSPPQDFYRSWSSLRCSHRNSRRRPINMQPYAVDRAPSLAQPK